MLHLRVISALVGMPVMLGAIYLGGPWYAFFLLLVVNLGLWEFDALLKAKGSRFPPLLGYVGVTAFIVLLFFEQYALVFPLLMVIFFALVLTQLAVFVEANFWESAMFFWGIIYLGGFVGYMLLIRLLPEGMLYTFILFVGVWINDTFAYFIGTKWGRHKLAPEISPKKSVEGALGGVAVTLCSAMAVAVLAPAVIGLPVWLAAILGLGIAVFAQLGDLLESSLKRQFQVHESGRLIPGHGGILDRLDSLLLAAPFVYYFFMLANRF